MWCPSPLAWCPTFALSRLFASSSSLGEQQRNIRDKECNRCRACIRPKRRRDVCLSVWGGGRRVRGAAIRRLRELSVFLACPLRSAVATSLLDIAHSHSIRGTGASCVGDLLCVVRFSTDGAHRQETRIYGDICIYIYTSEMRKEKDNLSSFFFLPHTHTHTGTRLHQRAG